jgi:DnaJ homolog subfamily C member 19
VSFHFRCHSFTIYSSSFFIIAIATISPGTEGRKARKTQQQGSDKKMSLQAAAAASLRWNNRGFCLLLLRNGKVPAGLPLSQLSPPRQAMKASSAAIVSGDHHHHHYWHGNKGGSGAYSSDWTMLTNRHSIHTYANSSTGGSFRREKDDPNDAAKKQQQQRFMMMAKSDFHSTTTNGKSAVALMLGFGALAAVSYAGAQGVRAYNEFKASLPEVEPMQEEEEAKAKTEDPRQQQQQARAQQKGRTAEKRENIFKEWFGVSVGAKYYEGGFEDKMTKGEAALILGVRESSPTQRIKEAHKRLVVLNHPDTGGSTYIALKINEAKELLLKGRMDK